MKLSTIYKIKNRKNYRCIFCKSVCNVGFYGRFLTCKECYLDGKFVLSNILPTTETVFIFEI